MSEINGRKSDRVHVLRETFLPNEPFQYALSTLVNTEPGRDKPRLFPIYGSDARFVEMAEAEEDAALEVQKQIADRFLRAERNTHLSLARITAKLLGSGALQLVMQPVNVADYVHIQNGLDKIQLGQRRRMDGVKPAELFTRIPADFLGSKHSIEETKEMIDEGLARRLYQVTPIPYLFDRTIPRPVPKPLSGQTSKP